MNYVKIPREIIYCKEMDNKRVWLFTYLCYRRSLDDRIAFSLSDICTWGGLKPNRRSGKINQTILELFEGIEKKEYFTEYPDFQKMSKSDINSYCYVVANIQKFDIMQSFSMIYFFEVEQILHFKEILERKQCEMEVSRLSADKLLLVLAYIRVNLNHNTKRPLCCYRLFQSISNDIGISERYIGKAVKVLTILGIIQCKEVARIRYRTNDSAKWKFLTGLKVFADCNKYDKQGNAIKGYDCNKEIQKQILELSKNELKMNHNEQ